VKETANKAINKSGQLAGEAAGELASGLGEGVENAFELSASVSDGLRGNGLSTGKTLLSSTAEGSDNLLSVYVVFEKDFNGTVVAKVFDGKNLEMGRCAATVAGKQNEARYVDFTFDKRTNIDHDSKVTLEQ
jgi:hypothetical protein